MTNLSANLTALAAASGCEPLLPRSSRVEVSADGGALFLAPEAGRRIALNSQRNPLAEARRALDEALRGRPWPSLVVVIGVGLGFLIDVLEERGFPGRILAIEPEPGCIRPLLERRDLSRLVAAGRLVLLWGPDYRGWTEAWRLFPASGDDPIVITSSVLSREAPDLTARCSQLVEQMAFGARANGEARRRFAGPYLLNTIRNLPAIVRERDAASLFGRFAGTPAIVAAAGPSLDRAKTELTVAGDRALVIAVDTAARPLLLAGVEPHLVVGVDPQALNAVHLRNLPACRRSRLVGEASLDPGAFAGFIGRSFVFQVSDHEPWSWLRSMGLGRARLLAWGSVLNTAFDLAVRLGCDPIVLVGADLAYTNSRPYCRGTSYEDAWREAVAAGASLPAIWESYCSAGGVVTEDIRGAKTATAPHFVAVRDWLRSQAAALTNRRVVNASGDGILFGPAIEVVALDRILGQFPRQSGFFDRLPPAGRGAADSTLVQRLAVGPAERSALVARWADWTDGTVSTAEVEGALAGALAELAQPHPHSPIAEPTPPPAGDGPDDPVRASIDIARARSTQAMWERLKGSNAMAWPPERTAIARAMSSGAPVPEWASGVTALLPHERTFLVSAFEAATEAILRLLARERVVHPCLAPPGGAPGGAAFEWLGDAAHDAHVIQRGFEAAERLGLLEGPTAGPRADSAALEDRTGSDENAGQPELGAGDTEWEARRLLVLQWAALLDAVNANAPEPTPGPVTASWCDWLADATRRGGCQAAARTRLAVRVSSARARALSYLGLRAPLWQLAPLLQGRVSRAERHPLSNSDASFVRPPVACASSGGATGAGLLVELLASDLDGSEDPRARFLTPDFRVDVVDLTRKGVRPANRCWPIDGERVLVSGGQGHRGTIVHADGRFEPGSPWPRPIVGEVPLADGRALAWGKAPTPFIALRSAGTGAATVKEVPFRAHRPLVVAGSFFWSAHDGLWQGSPEGGEIRHLSDVGPVYGLQECPGGLRLDPIFGVGRIVRRRDGVAWLWNPATRQTIVEPLGALGPCWSTTSSGTWRVEVYPNADAVRLAGKGYELLLACVYPMHAAWAGATLVVTSMFGQVWAFPNLADAVDRELG